MRKGLSFFLIFIVWTSVLPAAPSYQSLLKKWTRHEKVYVWDNLEARAIAHATYLSPEVRRAQAQQLEEIYGQSIPPRVGGAGRFGSKSGENPDSPPNPHRGPNFVGTGRESKDDERFDVFFLSLYAGSSEWPDIGRNSAQWGAVLEPASGLVREAEVFERVPITGVERRLFPYLDYWSQGYWIKFPKTLRPGESFRLRLTGLPVKTELVWK